MSKESLITQATLHAALAYDQSTGVFTWVKSNGRVVAGGIAGNITASGYMVVGLAGVKYRQHRLAWLHAHGVWPTGTIDHIDGNRANNALVNLRDVSRSINMQNIRKATISSKSGVLGVYFSRRREGYMASISLNGKQKRRGPYRTASRAQVAYLDLKRTHHEGCTL